MSNYHNSSDPWKDSPERVRYEDGLEVAVPSDPEPVFVVPHDANEKILVGDRWAPGVTGTVGGAYDDKIPVAGARTTPWRRRKRFLVIGALLIVAIALGVGLGVGLSSKKGGEQDATVDNTTQDDQNAPGQTSNDNDDDQTDDSEPLPSCAGDLCPRILSSIVFDNSVLSIFARTKDDVIGYIRYNNDSWTPWQNLGKMTGALRSQPTAFYWTPHGDVPRIDVAVISSDPPLVLNKWYSEYEGWQPIGDWDNIGYNQGTPVSMCLGGRNRLDMWSSDYTTDQSTHQYWRAVPEDDLPEGPTPKDTTELGAWGLAPEKWSPQTFRSKATPAVICRNSSTRHDIIYYNDNGDGSHTAYSDSGWSPVKSFEGKYIGDPSLFSFESDRLHWDFFGVKMGGEMHHIAWSLQDTSAGVYTDPANLGGNITSVPSVISLKRGVLDVVALGANGTLQHIHYDGSNWSEEWEDLGIRAHSAPILTTFADEVYLNAISYTGDLLSWTRNSIISETWKESLSAVKNLRGNLTLEYLIDNP